MNPSDRGNKMEMARHLGISQISIKPPASWKTLPRDAEVNGTHTPSHRTAPNQGRLVHQAAPR